MGISDRDHTRYFQFLKVLFFFQMTAKLLECEHLIKLFGLDYLINKASRIFFLSLIFFSVNMVYFYKQK